MLLPYDELNSVLARLETEAAVTSPNGSKRYDADKCCDIILDYLIYCYAMGVDDVNEMLSTSLTVNTDEMREVIYKRIEGKNFVERVREYAERSERTEQPQQPSERPSASGERPPGGGETPSGGETPIRPTEPPKQPFRPSPGQGTSPIPTESFPSTPHVPKDPDLYDIFRVAETEGHRAFGEAEYLTAKKGGATSKTWITMEDDRVRSTHEYIDRLEVGIDDRFVTWDGDSALYPGDFGLAENNVNCRCYCNYSYG